MDLKKKVTISWSGGKDSAFALYKIFQNPAYEVVGLHTVFNAESRRVGLHGVPEVLIRRQADALGLPLQSLYLPTANDHEAYKVLMEAFYKKAKSDGVDAVVFGDIFLEDLKRFRDELLTTSGLTGVYPLWQLGSRALIEEFLASGFRTVICTANASLLSADFIGQTMTSQLVSRLPEDVDVCGENGEFHTYVYAGPLFKRSLEFRLGEQIINDYEYKIVNSSGKQQDVRTQFYFQELL